MPEANVLRVLLLSLITSKIYICGYYLIDCVILNVIILQKISTELYELAGDLAQKMNQPNAAIDYYRKGKVFARAIELARNVSPEEVTTLEEEWGDWLVSRRQADASISHYIEAGTTAKALEAAIVSKQWLKAVQVKHSFFSSFYQILGVNILI